MSDEAPDATPKSDESTPWVYRLTNRGQGDVLLEVGDAFEPSAAFADDDNGAVAQIGLDLVRKGLSFLGHSEQSARAICLLALRSDNAISWEL